MKAALIKAPSLNFQALKKLMLTTLQFPNPKVISKSVPFSLRNYMYIFSSLFFLKSFRERLEI